jgi:hypothetical protein
MRRHVIVGVINISTDVDKLYDTDLSDAGWAPSGQEFQGRPRKTRSPRRCAPTLPYVPNYLTCPSFCYGRYRRASRTAVE